MNSIIPNDKLAKPATMDPEDRLFRHEKKPEWGIGVWVKEEATRRRLMFGDGELRAFKKGWYDLLVPVDPDHVDVEEEFEQLVADHAAVRDEREALKKPTKPPVMAFEDQIRVFEDLYPGGFTGETWLEKWRRPDEGRKPRKGHVDPSIAMAKELLEEKALKGLLEEGDVDEIHARVVQVLSRTTLVSPSKGSKLVQPLEGEARRALAEGVVDLLYGERRFRRRFGDWVKTLRGTCGLDAGWSLVTVLPALVFPEKHVAVKRRPFVLQAREIKPDARISRKLRKRSYKHARRVARRVRKRLRDAGHEPADLMDVRLFLWATLRPKSQKHLETLG